MNPVVGCYHLPPGPQRHTHMHIMNPAVGCHYFPPGPQLPSRPSGVTAFRPVPTYMAWWQRHIGVRNLPKVFTMRARLRLEPTTSWSHVRRSTTAPRRHLKSSYWAPISHNWTFSLSPTVEPLRANVEWKSPFLKPGGSLWPKISRKRGRPPPTILCVR